MSLSVGVISFWLRSDEKCIWCWFGDLVFDRSCGCCYVNENTQYEKLNEYRMGFLICVVYGNVAMRLDWFVCVAVMMYMPEWCGVY